MRNTLGFLFTTLRDFLVGRKTYLVAILVIAVTGWLVFLGRLTPETASVVALVALSLCAATFRSALAAHQQDFLKVLIDAGELGKSVAAKKVSSQAGIALVQDMGILVTEVRQDYQGSAVGPRITVPATSTSGESAAPGTGRWV